ncbi:hypothetical protein, partial [Bradyrhizobium sp.]|uniref:hypothetical protein n=1 Tax=Bradyrhizobium sp. TaxID=376 RepID=UPI003C77C004
AGVTGLRAVAGGKAACWRAAGARDGVGARASWAEVAGTAVSAGAVFRAAVGVAGVVFGATLRAIGRGFGRGTLGLARASAVIPDKATASIRLVASAVDRNAAARAEGVTAFLCGRRIIQSLKP